MRGRSPVAELQLSEMSHNRILKHIVLPADGGSKDGKAAASVDILPRNMKNKIPNIPSPAQDLDLGCQCTGPVERHFQYRPIVGGRYHITFGQKRQR
jgi:hypothetical protein